MDYTHSFAISAIGMGIERARVDAAALNLANANTVQTAGSPAYQPLRVITDARAIQAALENSDVSSFNDLVSQGIGDTGVASMGAPIVRFMTAAQAPRQVYEPGHPLADARGYVAYAGVDTATEMVSMMSATRAYEANVAAMNTTRHLALKTLEIGGGNA